MRPISSESLRKTNVLHSTAYHTLTTKEGHTPCSSIGHEMLIRDLTEVHVLWLLVGVAMHVIVWARWHGQISLKITDGVYDKNCCNTTVLHFPRLIQDIGLVCKPKFRANSQNWNIVGIQDYCNSSMNKIYRLQEEKRAQAISMFT